MKKKKLIIGIGVVAVLAGTIVYFNSKEPPLAQRSSIVLEPTTLSNQVNVTGVVVSEDNANVYSALSNKVTEVLVEVGDVVEEGAVLAKLDTTELQMDIARLNAGIQSSKNQSQLKLDVTQKNYETAKKNLEKDLNQKILAAEADLTSSELSVFGTREAVRNYRKENDGYGTDYELDQLVNASEKAYAAYEASQANLKAVKASVKQELASFEDEIKAAELGNDYTSQYLEIQKIQKYINDSTIKAPISGTVTQVSAKEGTPGQGLLFVIENTDNIKVETKIKEYDLANVEVGNTVTIKSDATGEDEYEGVVKSIAPTSVKEGTSSDVEFLTDVAVLSESTKLRIGVNARLSVLTEEKENVLAIPYEALVEQDDGKTIVYRAIQQEDGTWTAQAVEVQIGMETDFYIEVSGADLKAGDEIITEIEDLTDGAPIQLASKAAEMQAA